MTLFEKARERGAEIVGGVATGCPWVHGLESKEESLAFCAGHDCVECYAREYKGAVAQTSDAGNGVALQERAEVYRMALGTYGTTVQMIVALEELSEAQKEICKQLRGQGSLDHLAEEVADATIVLEQVRLTYGIDALVCEKMDEKVERLRQRLARAKGKKEVTE